MVHRLRKRTEPYTFSKNSTEEEKKNSGGPHTFSTNSTEEENKNSTGPHIFSTNSTEEENKNSAGPLRRGGEGENGCSAIH